jgi:hypothetical protein
MNPPNNPFAPPTGHEPIKDGKPVITELEADFRETLAGVQAEQVAIRQGADPGTLGLLMKSGDGPPTVCGFTLQGIQGGQLTLAALTTLQLMESAVSFPTGSQRTVGAILCIADPVKYWGVLTSTSEEFITVVNETIFERGIKVSEMTKIDAYIKGCISQAQEDQEQIESFSKASPLTQEPGSPT